MKSLVRLLPLAALLCGCELISNDDSGEAFAAASGAAPAAAATAAPASSSSETTSKAGSIVGTWLLKEKSGSGSGYAFFKADGSWYIKDTPSASRTRVSGSYKVGGNKFSGSMKNPGVGEGEISGTFSGNSMDFTFVEYWHTPHKTVLYKGTKQ